MIAAAKAGDVEGIIRLLQAEGGVAGVDFDRADANGVSPIMWAAWKGHSEVLVRRRLCVRINVWTACVSAGCDVGYFVN